MLTRTLAGPDDPRSPVALLEVRVLHEGATGPARVYAPVAAMSDPAMEPGRTVTVTTGGLGGTDHILR